MTKLLGIVVAGGLSSENRVFASLLAERRDRYEPLVVVQDSGASVRGTAHDFAALAESPTKPFDTGYRPNPSLRRYHPARVLVVMDFRRRLGQMATAVKPFHADLVYSSQQHYDCRAATKVARSLDVPQIVHLHYNVGLWLRPFVLDRLRTTDHVVAVSDFIRQQAIGHGVPEDRVTTIRNTMSPYVSPKSEEIHQVRAELGLADGRYVFGVVGRLDEGKGHLDAIAAFESVTGAHDDSALVLVGTGRIEAEVRERASGSALADKIIVTGQRSDVPALLSVFDCFVHPATQDPCPLAVLEAMAAALPVLAYDDGGVPELVEPGVTGLLVPHGDVPALAEGMQALRDNAARGRELGTAGARRVASDFSPADAGDKFAGLVTSMA